MDEIHPGHPVYWNSRYRSGKTPWDFGGVPAALQAYLQLKPRDTKPAARNRVLIPGCGSGYDVTAIDIAPAAVERARQVAGPALARHIVTGDFFQHDFAAASFDVIYERTFVCAFPPDRRPAWRDRIATLLKDHGFLVGYFSTRIPCWRKARLSALPGARPRSFLRAIFSWAMTSR